MTHTRLLAIVILTAPLLVSLLVNGGVVHP